MDKGRSLSDSTGPFSAGAEDLGTPIWIVWDTGPRSMVVIDPDGRVSFDIGVASGPRTAFGQQAVGFAELSNDLVGGVAASFHLWVLSCPVSGHSELSQGVDQPQGGQVTATELRDSGD